MAGNDIGAAARFTAYLTSEGARVEAADTGEEALELLRRYEFDIVVLNLALPDMEGSTAIRRMRMAGKDTPVMALVCSSIAEPKVRALTAGADDAGRPIGRA